MIKYAWTELKRLSQHLIECTAELKTIKRTLTTMLKGNHRQWLQIFELNFTKHFRSAKWFIISTSNSVSIQESVCPLCGEANSQLETKLNSYFLLLLLSTGEPAEGFYCVEAIGNTMYLSQKLAQLRYQLVVKIWTDCILCYLFQLICSKYCRVKSRNRVSWWISRTVLARLKWLQLLMVLSANMPTPIHPYY